MYHILLNTASIIFYIMFLDIPFQSFAKIFFVITSTKFFCNGYSVMDSVIEIHDYIMITNFFHSILKLTSLKPNRIIDT